METLAPTDSDYLPKKKLRPRESLNDIDIGSVELTDFLRGDTRVNSRKCFGV